MNTEKNSKETQIMEQDKYLESKNMSKSNKRSVSPQYKSKVNKKVE